MRPILRLIAAASLSIMAAVSTSARGDDVLELYRRAETICKEIAPEDGRWILDKWHPALVKPKGGAMAAWRRPAEEETHVQTRTEKRYAAVEFRVFESEAGAVGELESGNRFAQVGPSGECDLTPNCYYWMTHLEKRVPVTVKLTRGQVWVGVSADSRATAFAFARAVLEGLARKEGATTE